VIKILAAGFIGKNIYPVNPEYVKKQYPKMNDFYPSEVSWIPLTFFLLSIGRIV